MRTKTFYGLILSVAVFILSSYTFAEENTAKSSKLDKIVRERLSMDLASLENLPGFEPQKALHQEIANLPEISTIDWRRGVPYNSLHRRIWSTHAAWAKKKLAVAEPLLIWTANRWDDLHPFDLPTVEQLKQTSIDVKMIRGEYRAAVLNLTNLSDNSVIVNIGCEFDKKLSNGLISVREVIFVETQSRKIVANALPVAAKNGDLWQVEVPAGATRQVWLMFHPTNIDAGKYTGRIKVECNAIKAAQSVQTTLEVYPFDFRKSRH